MIKNRFTEVEKPVIIIAQDNSESAAQSYIDIGADNYHKKLDSLISDLSKDYEVKTFDIGDGIKTGISKTYSDKVTNISSALSDISENFHNQNVGAIIMASDGIYNEGSNPVYNTKMLNVPIYNIALGDTTPKTDLKIEKLYHNKIAYLNDKFTLRVDVGANNLKGKSATVSVYNITDKNNTFKETSKSFSIKNNQWVDTYDLTVDARTPGMQRYSVRVSTLKSEVTAENNVQYAYIDILDSRQRILILAESPHPDLSALKSAIEKNKNYETKTEFIRKFDGNIRPYDLVILHNLPSTNKPVTSIIDEINRFQKSAWFIIGSRTSPSNINSAQSILQINGGTNANLNQIKAALSDGFNLFTIDAQFGQKVEQLPPLINPFGEYSGGPTGQPLLKQKVGTVDTKYPLLIFEQSGRHKIAVLAGEGLWRWRLYDYQKDSDHETVDELVSKTIQFLAIKDDKRKFRVSIAKELYFENEAIAFDAELYNDSYELINAADASISIYDSNGKEYPFSFNKTANAYTLNAGFFPIGDYSYKARCVYLGEQLEYSGKFSVVPLQLEALQTTANHQILHALSKKFEGKVLYPAQMEELGSLIRNKDEIQSLLYSTYKNQYMINLRWLFFVLLALLAIEWFIRKFNGAY